MTGEVSTADAISVGRLVRRVGGKMPLLPGKQNIGANIRELTNNGSRPRSRKQIVAIALHEAEKHPDPLKPPKLKLPKAGGRVGILKAMNPR